jgi:hypothetical protein
MVSITSTEACVNGFRRIAANTAGVAPVVDCPETRPGEEDA